MINRIGVIPRPQARGNALLLTLAAATVAGLLASSAHAEQDDFHNKRPQNVHRDMRPQAVQREHELEREQYQHRYEGYYRQPDIYYTAPPVIYPPAGYYQQPGVSLNFNFPFIR